MSKCKKIIPNIEPIPATKLLAEYVNPFTKLDEKPKMLQPMREIIEYGNFFKQLKPFLEIFKKKDVLFIDGGGLIKNPELEYSKFEKFFGVRHELRFKFNETKGFPCLHRPVPMCLGDNKGRTHGNHQKSPDQTIPEYMRLDSNF